MITHVTPSPVFAQKGAHLEVEVPLTVVEALRGAEVEVPTLSGRKTLRVAPGTRHGTVQRLRGEGPPRPGGKGNGDIHYRFVIDMPDEADRRAGQGRRRAREDDERRRPAREAVRGGGDEMSTRPPQRSHRVDVAADRGVFMISVAAELAEMHPQTLRMYEARGLIEPSRSPKGTRLYSQADVERLRRIQQMTVEMGLNLAGVERVLALEAELDAAHDRLEELARQADVARRAAAGGARRAAPLDVVGHRALQRRVDRAGARRRRALAVPTAARASEAPVSAAASRGRARRPGSP